VPPPRQRQGVAGRRPRDRRGSKSGRGERAAKGSPRVTLLEGDCFEQMAGLNAESVDAIVTDPPYGIGWKNKRWDSSAIREAAASLGRQRLTANEAYAVWCRSWAEKCLRVLKPGAHLLAFGGTRTHHRLACGLEDAGFEIRDTLMWLYGTGVPKSHRHPGGLSTTLKPAFEPIVLARKPLEGTTAETIEQFGTGALNVDSCRVEGRFPANVLAGHKAECREKECAPGCAVSLLDADAARGGTDSSLRLAPSRFLYCPKPSRAEREAGCEGLPDHLLDLFPVVGRRPKTTTRNPHPTLKPLDLMRWLVRLACPADGVLLDPFMGSGTTGAAAVLERRAFCGVELEAPYIKVAAARIAHWADRADAVGPGVERRRPLGSRRR
jgi:DNA modification methylase